MAECVALLNVVKTAPCLLSKPRNGDFIVRPRCFLDLPLEQAIEFRALVLRTSRGPAMEMSEGRVLEGAIRLARAPGPRKTRPGSSVLSRSIKKCR